MVWKGELILIFGSKIHNLWTIFYCRTKISLKIQPEIQKSGFKNFWPKNDKNYARFRALKSILEFNDNIGYFDMFQGFKKATPYGGTRKLRLTLPPVHRAYITK